MKLNLKYYSGKDEYFDGDIEDKILEFIKKYPKNYEEAFTEDSSWPVIYHLSEIRKNIIKWYPFKKNASILEVGAGMGAITEELVKKCGKVTSIELSKRRASAILERNKNATNLEIVVGNFKNIKLEEKYDYILLNGVLEYAALYIDSTSPYIDFINKLKENLKPSGKILIAIENRMGLKYWCGANEDHTGMSFDGINNYSQSNNIRTFDKCELTNICNECNMFSNFYYVFPDYKFPEIIVTDKFLAKHNYFDYCPYYYTNMNLIMDEYSTFDSVRNNNAVPYMANSFFVELSLKSTKQEIEYVKFNNYRNKNYNLMNYINNGKFYKEACFEEAIEHIETIKNIYNKMNNKDLLPLSFDNNKISCDIVNLPLLKDIIQTYKKNDDKESIVKELTKLFEYVKKNCGKKITRPDNNVFTKYQVDVAEPTFDQLHFYEDGIVDMIPSNIFIKNKKYIIIDQEWYEENCPIEYCYFRIIINTFFDENERKYYFDKFNLNEYVNIFYKLEEKFIGNIKCNSDQYYLSYKNNGNTIYNIIDVNNNLKNELELTKQNYIQLEESKNQEINNLVNEKNNVENRLNNILNSKGYKLLNKFYKIQDKVRRK